MRDVQTPRYTLIGMGDGHEVLWHVLRSADGALAALAQAYVADDGHPCEAAPVVCTFKHAENAGQFLTHVEDNTVPRYLHEVHPRLQARLAWVRPEPYVAPDWDGVGVLGNIEVDASVFE
jgi:hypothetical protein